MGDDSTRWQGPSAGFSRNASAIITAVDDSMTEVLGWRPDQLIGRPSTDFVHPADQASAVAAWMAMVKAPGDRRMWRGRYQGSDGTWKWVEAVNVNRLHDPDSPVVLSTMTLVAHDQVSVEEELQAREQLISRLADALPVGLFQIDTNRRISFTNDRFHAIVGLPRAATIDAQFLNVEPADRGRLDAVLSAVLDDQVVEDLDIRLCSSPGGPGLATTEEQVCVVALRPLTDGAGRVTGAIGCLSDITDRVQLQRDLESRATTDGLTSCLSRGTALELLDASLATYGDRHAGTAIMFVDLDRFKQVNDQLGHAAGDTVLQVAAQRLAATVRDGDRVGRIGGDEFLVICPDVADSSKALDLGQRLARAVAVDVVVGLQTVELRASVGVAWTDQRLEADVFVAQADAAMYQSKQARRAGASLWSSSDNVSAEEGVHPGHELGAVLKQEGVAGARI